MLEQFLGKRRSLRLHTVHDDLIDKMLTEHKDLYENDSHVMRCAIVYMAREKHNMRIEVVK